jgi:zinc D-Ala-D-Ala carboxypeptidase
MGDLSPHFSRSELWCHHCHQLKLADTLVPRLELLRARVGTPLPILSGYRCPVHNRQVGGAPHSLHLGGAAADFKPGLVRPTQAESAGFRGIGVHEGWCVHADVRPGPIVIFQDP